MLDLPSGFNTADIKKQIGNEDADAIIAVGGDGTVSLLADMASSFQKPLGIIPGGSANGMARELNIPENLDDALKIIEQEVYKPIDCISINGKTCIHLSDIGLNAQLIKYFEGSKLRGKWGYAKVVLKALSNRRLITVNLVNKKAQLTHEGYMIVLANASKYGTGAVINPIGSLSDGLFEIVIVKKLSFSALLRMLIKPGLFNPKTIQIYHAEEISINTKHRFPFQIDGEFMGNVNYINAKILPAYLNMIVPVNN